MRSTAVSPSASASPSTTNPYRSSSLITRLEEGAASGAAVTFVTPVDRDGWAEDRVPMARLHDDARSMAAALAALGVGPGAHVALLGPTTRDFVTALTAVWISGAAATVMPLPMRLASIEEFVDQTRRRITRADAALVVVDRDLAAFFDARPGDPPMVYLDDLAADAARRPPDSYVRPADDPDALAILQFTSGSTAHPKGVMVPHRSLTSNLTAIQEGLGLTPDDVAVSWLPLYHDMGLVGILANALTAPVDLVLGAPQDFLAAPARWVQWLSHFGGTCTGGPDFAYALAARAMRRPGSLDLSRWRIGLNGAEPIDPRSVESFLEAGAPHGLRPGVAFCAYGLAEATLGVTFPVPEKGMTVDPVDRRALEDAGEARPVADDAPGAKHFARVGWPLRDFDLKIAGPGGRALGDRQVGEIELRGPSLMSGYYRDPEATAAVLTDGWLRTGDLGYTIDGELVVCGRAKDVIIVGGRNVFPEDVERAVAGIEGVRTGNIIAFGAPAKRGREAIVVVAETRLDDPSPLRDEMSRRIVDAVGIPPADLVFVEPGSLPKTSSGKLQRSLCRKQHLESTLRTV
ncbi:MAG: fatty acyl-AMP ligase [Acidimicrobiia bacterium]|nr:fatty acyl-AMP ligase [Acidimicrobiia bacterium]